MTKKGFFTTVCVFLLAFALLMGLFACANEFTKPLLNKSKKVYAFSAMTSACLMKEAFGSAPENVSEASVMPSAVSLNDAEKEAARPEAVEGDLEELNRYMKMFEGYLLNNGVNETVSAPTEEDGEFAGYEYKVAMEVPTLTGEKESYVMYYTEYDQVTSEKIDFDDDDDDEKETVKTETSTRLEGKMLYGGAVYPVEGAKNVETEEGETEVEILFTTRLKDGDRQNYIEVKQSTETENAEQELEYEYKIVKDGKTVSKTKIEIETDSEEQEQEVKLVFFDASGATPSKTTYSFEREFLANGAAEIVIKYNKTGEPAGIIRVRAEQDGTYRFQYDNGFEETLD